MFSIVYIKLLIVLSASMGSALPVGSLAVSVPQEEYRVGDIVTFKIPDSTELLTHRIVKVDSTNGIKTFKTQGDANDVVDDWETASEDIVGKVVLRIPYLGYIFRLPQIILAWAL